MTSTKLGLNESPPARPHRGNPVAFASVFLLIAGTLSSCASLGRPGAAQGSQPATLPQVDYGSPPTEIEPLLQLPHTGAIADAAFSPDGKFVATAGHDGTARLWTLNGQLCRVFGAKGGNGTTSACTAIAFSPDGACLAVGDEQGLIRLFRTKDVAETGTLDPGGSFAVVWLGFSPEGARLLSVLCRKYEGKLDRNYNDSKAVAWEIRSGARLESGELPPAMAVRQSRDGKLLAIRSRTAVVVLDTGNLKMMWQDAKLMKEYYFYVSVDFSPDGRWLVTSNPTKHVIYFYPARSGGPATKLVLPYEYPVPAHLAYTPDGRQLIVNDTFNRRIVIWDLEKKSLEASQGSGGYMREMKVSPDGNSLLIRGDETAEVSRLDSFRPLARFGSAIASKLIDGSLSPDGKWLAIRHMVVRETSNGPEFPKHLARVYLWNLAEGRLVFTKAHETESLGPLLRTYGICAFTDDSRKFVYRVSGYAYAMDLLDGSEALIDDAGIDRLGLGFRHEAGRLRLEATGQPGMMRLSGIAGEAGKNGAAPSGAGEALTFFVDGTESWVVLADSGHFDCSDDSKDRVAFVRGMDVYTATQVWDQFWDPGLVSVASAGGMAPVGASSPGELSGAQRARSIAEAIARAPRVSLTTSLAGRETGEASLKVRIFVEAGAGDPGPAYLYRNGRVLDEQSRGLSVESSGSFREFEIGLVEGENEIVAAARDRESLAEGRSVPLTIVYRPVKVVRPDLYILAVGVASYRDPDLALGSPDEDAVAVAKRFEEVGGRLYGRVDKVVLVDKAASREGIRAALENIAASAKVEDAVILFMAGHGLCEGGQFYYLPWDADITADLSKSCLTSAELGEWLRKAAAGKIALFLDTCQSGAAVKSLGAVALSRGIEERRVIANLARSRGVAILSGAAEGEAAFEIRELGYGLLTYSLLEALGTRIGETVSENQVSIGKLMSVVNGSTRALARRYLGMDQSPVLYAFGDDFSLGLGQ